MKSASDPLDKIGVLQDDAISDLGAASAAIVGDKLDDFFVVTPSQNLLRGKGRGVVLCWLHKSSEKMLAFVPIVRGASPLNVHREGQNQV